MRTQRWKVFKVKYTYEKNSNKKSISELWDSFKRPKIYVTGWSPCMWGGGGGNKAEKQKKHVK